MSLENIGLSVLGARVIEQSSSSDSHLYSSSNLLKEQQDQIWNSGEGLPQYIVISLQDVAFKYSHLERIGFYCWHDYTTNPKVIEMEVAQGRGQSFTQWQSFTLKKQSGKQYFEMSHLPSSYCIIKIIITETFGDFQTYLNQIFLLASPQEDSRLPHQLEIGDLDPSLKLQSDREDSMADESKSAMKIVKRLSDSRGSGKQKKSANYKVYRDNTFFNEQRYPTQKSNYEKGKAGSLREEGEVSGDESMKKDVALLTLSNNVLLMEENIEDIRRELEVLDLKINVSYQNLEKKIMQKVERAMDRKLEQFRREILHTGEQREVAVQNDKKQSLKQKDERYRSEQMIGKDWKEPGSRQIKRSLHLASLNKQEQTQKQELVSDLMHQLARKLKERAKLKKIEVKRQRQKQQLHKQSREH